MAISPLITNNFIDSCAFDPKYEPETSASVKIFGLSEGTDLLLQIAHSTQKEIDHPNTPNWVKQKAREFIFTLQVQLTSNETKILREIESTLAGNGKVENIAQDARHIFEAQKYGTYFITTDGLILRRADALRKRFGVQVLKPSDFLALTKKHLAAKGKLRT